VSEESKKKGLKVRTEVMDEEFINQAHTIRLN